jgi:hypothetical protein
VAQHQLLAHHAAQRDAEDVRLRPAERADQPGGVVSEIGHAERRLGAIALADPPVVIGDDVEVRLQQRQEILAPHPVMAGHPHDQQQRLSPAAAQVAQLGHRNSIQVAVMVRLSPARHTTGLQSPFRQQ